MAPEEFDKGSIIDSRTDVFTMGAAAFVFLADENRTRDGWKASESLFEVALKAISPNREERYPNIRNFLSIGAWHTNWLKTIHFKGVWIIQMSFVVREYCEKDFEQVSNISHVVYAKRVGSFSIVSNVHDNRMLKRYVVIDGKEQIAGYGLLWEQHTSPDLILKMEILFQSGYENSNAVITLFDVLNKDIQKIGPLAVQARTFDDQTCLLQSYRNYGFVENHRMIHAYLTANDTQYIPYADIENRLKSKEIIITTLAKEQISDADYYRKLQTLNKDTWTDYPSELIVTLTPPSDVWLTHKNNIADAYFIAKMGDTYIGHSHLMRMESDSETLIQGLTATLRGSRGQGVATALKIKGIEYAKRNGYQGIFTSYRNINTPMKLVNEKLGWQPYYNEVRLEKII